jgi:hypothetical protein
LTLLSDAVDQAHGIQQRCRLIERLLDIERNLDRFVGKSRACTGISGTRNSGGSVEASTDLRQVCPDR